MKYFTVLFSLQTIIIFALNNGVGITPPMGWSSRSAFGCSITEEIVQNQAGLLVSLNLAALNYTYVVIDDCWQGTRDPVTKVIQPNATTFPSGMTVLADSIHKQGLLLGLSSDAGTKTCAGMPGSLYYETLDAQTYASWGVDYLKYDNCYHKNLPNKWRFQKMGAALNATGRPIYYAMCEGGQDAPWTWGPQVANSWRIGGNVIPEWLPIDGVIEAAKPLTNYPKPGAWNDLDILDLVAFGSSDSSDTTDEKMNFAAYQTQFAMWCLLKSPLLISADLTVLEEEEIFSIYQNTDLIGVNQDALGLSATFIEYENSDNTTEIWAGELTGEAVVVALLNNDDSESEDVTFNFTDIGFSSISTIRDLIAQQDLNVTQYVVNNTYTDSISARGISVIKVTGETEEEAFMNFRRIREIRE